MLTHTWNRFVVLAAIVLFVAPLARAQSASSIAVTGAVPQPLTLTAADMANMPRTSLTMKNNGIETVYEGVLLSDVLKKAGMRLGEALRGPALAAYVLASASDGYQVLFSIGELDPEMTDNQFLLADKANGKALFGENGAFRLVIPKDKRGARSVRQLTKLEIVQLRK
jgi:DMSO/TMAO reductase YedYZ molybdopterin-dependent catalytic subunit